VKLSKKRLDAILNVVALAFLFLIVPGMVYVGNAWNGFLGSTYEWDAQENATSLYQGPVIDGDSSEYRMASVNDTGDVEETPVWDVSSDWDQVTIVNTGAQVKLIMNLNITANELLNSKYYSLRVKTNGTQPLKISCFAVKFDGVTLTQQQIDESITVRNGSRTAYFNWTPAEILQVETLLNPELDDETYLQLVFESSSSTDNLTTGDVIQYQIHLGKPSNVYTFSSIQILRGVATIGGILFIMCAFASTSAWNPLSGNDAFAKAKRSYRKRKARKTPKRKSSRRRR